jgi:uncharacterized phage protein gp47/JayE
VNDYVRPSYAALKSRIEADLAAMPAVLRDGLTAAWAKACHGEHGFLEWVDEQCSPLTCTLARLYDWAALYGVDRLPAVAATGSVTATGANGSPVLADTVLRGQNGLDYKVLAAVALVGGSGELSIRCLTPGAEGNLAAGVTLTLVDPIPNVDNSMIVTAGGLSGGAAEEDVEAWRGRVAEEWTVVTTRGARSGKPDDYRFWARSAHPSVTGALVQPHALGVGTVLVRPICNGLADRAPSPAVLAAVAAYFYVMVPATADWRLAVPIRHGVTISIDLLPAADTAGNRAAISAALQAAVLAESTEDALLAMAEIDAAVATVTSQYTRLAPLADIAAGAGEVLVLDPVVFA